MAAPFLSVVIPAYNEAERIGATLDKVIAYLDQQNYTWEVLVVDDGSADETRDVVVNKATSANAPLRVETIPHAGKGWAVRHGMLATSGRYRFMCDADLSMPIETLGSFLERMDEGNDIVIASREAPGAGRHGELIARHLRGRIFNWLVRLLAVRGIDDTQCGFKLFRGDVAQDLFGRQRTKGFAFDVEILYMAKGQGLRVLEMPVDWYHDSASRVRPLAEPFLMLRDALLVRLRRQ